MEFFQFAGAHSVPISRPVPFPFLKAAKLDHIQHAALW